LAASSDEERKGLFHYLKWVSFLWHEDEPETSHYMFILLFRHPHLSTYKFQRWSSMNRPGTGEIRFAIGTIPLEFFFFFDGRLVLLQQSSRIFSDPFDITLDEVTLGAILFLIAKQFVTAFGTNDADRPIGIDHGAPFWFGRQRENVVAVIASHGKRRSRRS
jgi:hypothetical protein